MATSPKVVRIAHPLSPQVHNMFHAVLSSNGQCCGALGERFIMGQTLGDVQREAAIQLPDCIVCKFAFPVAPIEITCEVGHLTLHLVYYFSYNPITFAFEIVRSDERQLVIMFPPRAIAFDVGSIVKAYDDEHLKFKRDDAPPSGTD